MKDYKISVITPIYNVEAYLEEALDSVVNQTIGFKDHIQLILVNDGSPDRSSEICERFQRLYPDNVEYIEKDNGGVSSARNAGLEYIQGDYVVFLDGDDTWERTAFKKIYDFFETSNEKFNVCSCKLEFTGDFKDKTHPLDYKFADGKRVVDLMSEPMVVNSTIGNSVFRSEAIKNIRFKESISAGEDSEFVNTALLDKPLLGVLPEATFYYRRNYNAGSGSSSAPNRKSWYLDVPREYYLSLCNKSKEKYGSVLPFIQHVILYDMRWRHYNPRMNEILSEEEKKTHLDLMQQILCNFDPAVIYDAEGHSQYRKLYYMNLRHGTDVIDGAVLKGHRYYFGEQSVINLHGRGILKVKVLDINNNILHIAGLLRLSVIRRPYRLFIKVGEKEYEIEKQRYDGAGVLGYFGEEITKGEIYEATLPIRHGAKLSFFVEVEGERLRLRPTFDAYIGLIPKINNNYYSNSFCVRDGYIVKHSKGYIGFYNDRKQTLAATEARFIRDVAKKDGLAESLRQLKKIHLSRIAYHSNIRNKVAFITVRSDDELQGNLKKVYDQLDIPKALIAKKSLYMYPQIVLKAVKLIYTSKIVVTDDYMFLFRNYGKRQGQTFIQLWHAAGAGKRFGKDGGLNFPVADSQYHKDYDIVPVSGEASRKAFASAFNLPENRFFNIGVARTDDFFDEQLLTAAKQKVLHLHPELEEKQVILYAPTFRETPGLGRSFFRPDIDWYELSKSLRPNQIIAIKPHPVMTERIVPKGIDNIIEMRDVSTNDIMILSNLMISDYSSIMFEYVLLNKPMAFFCYDYDDYDRDFYMDFERELPGELLRTQEELIEYIAREEHHISECYETFRNRYMGSCDGHSTERIVSIIKDLYDNKK